MFFWPNNRKTHIARGHHARLQTKVLAVAMQMQHLASFCQAPSQTYKQIFFLRDSTQSNDRVFNVTLVSRYLKTCDKWVWKIKKFLFCLDEVSMASHVSKNEMSNVLRTRKLKIADTKARNWTQILSQECHNTFSWVIMRLVFMLSFYMLSFCTRFPHTAFNNLIHLNTTLNLRFLVMILVTLAYIVM